MKKFLLTLFSTIAAISAFATPFEYSYEGNTLKYEVLDETQKTATVGSNQDPKLSTNVVIPSKITYNGKEYTVTAIAANAFFRCEELPSVEMPSTLSSIGKKALYGCIALTSLTIPNSVNFIGEEAFAFSDNLISVQLSDALESIEKGTFHNCENLTTIKVPDAVVSIADEAFASCISLTSVELPEGLTSIGRESFYRADKLETITLPKSLMTIGEEAFAYCNSLTSVELSEGLTSIGRKSFYAADKLETITLPKSLMTIGDESFAYCQSLKSVYYAADTLISANKNVFSSYAYNDVNLYLTKSGMVKSQSVEPWKYFSHVEEYNSAGIQGISSEENAPIEVYELNGTKATSDIETLSPGIYIVRQGNTSKKIAIK